MKPHEWVVIPDVGYGLEWCSRCGTLKSGPFSEHGAYNYFVFRMVGPAGSYDGPPWKPEGFGFPYDECRNDPPCNALEKS